MVNLILFVDPIRQEEIETFYEICQSHRNFYRGYRKYEHPLQYFKEPQYNFQCPSEMSSVYLNYPIFHVKYRQPVVLPGGLDRRTEIPPLPDRCLGARYSRASSKNYVR